MRVYMSSNNNHRVSFLSCQQDVAVTKPSDTWDGWLDGNTVTYFANFWCFGFGDFMAAWMMNKRNTSHWNKNHQVNIKRCILSLVFPFFGGAHWKWSQFEKGLSSLSHSETESFYSACSASLKTLQVGCNIYRCSKRIMHCMCLKMPRLACFNICSLSVYNVK